ncbi:MAG: cytochrome c biogenesis protein CcdA [Thaumarchaeota archaeon]|nr:cytochrome c biogenesis protein CcdA [Nitrososphaerota archaeon]
MARKIDARGLILALTSLAMLLTLPVVITPASAHQIPEELRPAIMDALIGYDETSGRIEVSAIYAIDEYWHLQNLNPREYGLDPDRNLIFMLILNIHVGDLPGHGSPTPKWESIVSLSVDGRKELLPTSAKMVVDSPHHEVIGIEFAKSSDGRTPIITADSKKIDLMVKGLESADDIKDVAWSLPLTFSKDAAAAIRPSSNFLALGTLGAFFPLFAGLLVYFSPCFMEMTAVYLAMISGVRVSELSEKKNNRRFRLRILAAAILFVAGFASIYTAAGAIAGYSGSIMQGSIFEDLSFPLRLIGGSVLVYMGVQSSGIGPRIFGLRSSPLFPRANASCRIGGSFIVGLTFGCLQCFRGSLVVAMLFFAWSIGSAGMGATMLLLLSLSFGIPFILIALFAGRTTFLQRLAPRIGGYTRVATSFFLVTTGILIMIFDQHPLLDPLYGVWEGIIGIR